MSDLIGYTVFGLLVAGAIAVCIVTFPIVLVFIVIVTAADILSRCLIHKYGRRD
jgi:hypothetical protein